MIEITILIILFVLMAGVTIGGILYLFTSSLDELDEDKCDMKEKIEANINDEKRCPDCGRPMRKFRIHKDAMPYFRYACKYCQKAFLELDEYDSKRGDEKKRLLNGRVEILCTRRFSDMATFGTVVISENVQDSFVDQIHFVGREAANKALSMTCPAYINVRNGEFFILCSAHEEERKYVMHVYDFDIVE